MLLLLWPPLLFTLPAAAFEPPDPPPVSTGFLAKSLKIDDETFRYCVYVPPDYTPERPWPVILFLHGSGEAGADGFLQTDVGIARAIRRDHTRVPAIVVMPQCRPRQFWKGAMAAMALKCVEQTSREYHLDPQRVYLTGLSLGGAGTWHIAARFPDRFAALAPICGFGEESDAAKLRGVPIWCFHGAVDDRVRVDSARTMVDAARKAGADVKYTEFAGEGHLIWDKVYEDAKFWEWLFAQKRPDPAAAPAKDERP